LTLAGLGRDTGPGRRAGQRREQSHGRISPFRYIIDAMREAYLGHYFNTLMVEGIAVAVGMAVVFLWLGSRVFVQENA
jgi:ABC-type multidrug transport system permease subunit